MNILLEKLKVSIENEDFKLAAKLQKEINEIKLESKEMANKNL